MKSLVNRHYVLNLLYFLVMSAEVVAELFSISVISVGGRILLPVLLGLMYYTVSNRNNILFYLLLVLHLLSNVFFFSPNQSFFYYGIYAFILVRVVSLLIIFIQTKDKNYFQIVATSFPFLLVFFYLISVTDEISEFEFDTLILQSILISLLAGFSVTNYFREENRQHSWLLISTLLFIGLRFMVFIERFVTVGFTFGFNRPFSAILSAFAFYAFFKYLINSETNSSEY